MVTKRSLQTPRYDFLRRRASRNAKQATKKTSGEDFAFGKRAVRTSRKDRGGR